MSKTLFVVKNILSVDFACRACNCVIHLRRKYWIYYDIEKDIYNDSCCRLFFAMSAFCP
jgi:hypothetical protein